MASESSFDSVSFNHVSRSNSSDSQSTAGQDFLSSYLGFPRSVRTTTSPASAARSKRTGFLRSVKAAIMFPKYSIYILLQPESHDFNPLPPHRLFALSADAPRKNPLFEANNAQNQTARRNRSWQGGRAVGFLTLANAALRRRSGRSFSRCSMSDRYHIGLFFPAR